MCANLAREWQPSQYAPRLQLLYVLENSSQKPTRTQRRSSR